MSLKTLVQIEESGVMTADEFRQIHKSTGLSAAALSNASGISTVSISQYRSGKRPISRVFAHAMRNIQTIVDQSR